MLYEEEKRVIRDYEKMKPLLSQWGMLVDNQIKDILARKELKKATQIWPIFRVKANESLIYNVVYRKTCNSVDKVKDKVATRIVLTNMKQVEVLVKGINEHDSIWSANLSRIPQKTKQKNPRQFDYSSYHFNLIPKAQGIFEKMSKKKRAAYSCEVQVRTLLQHALAETEHDTLYKGPLGNNPEVIRMMAKAGALIEIVDDYFRNVSKFMESNAHIYRSLEKFLYEEYKILLKEELNVDNMKRMDKVNMKLLYESFRAFNINGDDIEKKMKIIFSSNRKNIVKLIRRTEGILKQEPVILLYAYLIVARSSSFVYKHWFLSRDLLDELRRAMGYSASPE